MIQMNFEYELRIIIGGLAQLARAPALHAGGQRFESVILHRKKGAIHRVALPSRWLGRWSQDIVAEQCRWPQDIVAEQMVPGIAWV